MGCLRARHSGESDVGRSISNDQIIRLRRIQSANFKDMLDKLLSSVIESFGRQPHITSFFFGAV